MKLGSCRGTTGTKQRADGQQLQLLAVQLGAADSCSKHSFSNKDGWHAGGSKQLSTDETAVWMSMPVTQVPLKLTAVLHTECGHLLSAPPSPTHLLQLIVPEQAHVPIV